MWEGSLATLMQSCSHGALEELPAAAAGCELSAELLPHRCQNSIGSSQGPAVKVCCTKLMSCWQGISSGWL